jgi:hypothetical protein
MDDSKLLALVQILLTVRDQLKTMSTASLLRGSRRAAKSDSKQETTKKVAEYMEFILEIFRQRRKLGAFLHFDVSSSSTLSNCRINSC